MTVMEPDVTLALLQLAARADTLATQRNAAGYAALFTQDAVMDGDEGRVAGREKLATAVARVWEAEPPGTLHLTCNAVVDDTAATPTVASILLLLTPHPPGFAADAARVLQRFRHTPQGWRISSRQITMISTAAPDASQKGPALTPATPNHPEPDASPSFASDIKPLFREHDRAAMQRAFDLWSYDDVVAHGQAIAARLRDGSMPCDGPWPGDQVTLFERWVSDGSPP